MFYFPTSLEWDKHVTFILFKWLHKPPTSHDSSAESNFQYWSLRPEARWWPTKGLRCYVVTDILLYISTTFQTWPAYDLHSYLFALTHICFHRGCSVFGTPACTRSESWFPGRCQADSFTGSSCIDACQAFPRKQLFLVASFFWSFWKVSFMWFFWIHCFGSIEFWDFWIHFVGTKARMNGKRPWNWRSNEALAVFLAMEETTKKNKLGAFDAFLFKQLRKDQFCMAKLFFFEYLW